MHVILGGLNSGGLMTGGLMSCGLKSGGLMSGVLKSCIYDQAYFNYDFQPFFCRTKQLEIICLAKLNIRQKTHVAAATFSNQSCYTVHPYTNKTYFVVNRLPGIIHQQA